MNPIKIKVECPNCHNTLNVNYYDGIESAHITCPVPKCGVKLPFKSYLLVQETLIRAVTPVLGCLTVKSTGERHDLQEGEYILGRAGVKVEADIKFNVTDRRMSRHHMKLTIRHINQNYLHHIQKAKEGVVIHVNGIELNDYDIVTLNYGDTISLGDTYILFDRSTPTN